MDKADLLEWLLNNERVIYAKVCELATREFFDPDKTKQQIVGAVLRHMADKFDPPQDKAEA
jgi:hypothetical protein